MHTKMLYYVMSPKEIMLCKLCAVEKYTLHTFLFRNGEDIWLIHGSITLEIRLWFLLELMQSV